MPSLDLSCREPRSYWYWEFMYNVSGSLPSALSEADDVWVEIALVDTWFNGAVNSIPVGRARA